MTISGLDVRPFTPDNFLDAIRSPRQTPAQVKAHTGAGYLLRYLTQLKAKTLVVEHDYTDGDYLDDYASYYVKSFEDYGRRCKRLHFFSDDFDAAALVSMLAAAAPATTLQAAYLGFVVARPLPTAIVGRTVLCTYPPDGSRRNYPAVRPYTAHLFGTPLTVQSLAFQEQDTVLAACATVSLWSAFQKASALFGTRAPTPAEITRSASPGLYTGRALPSKGLNIAQMARAVSEAGLEPDVFQCSARLPLLSLLHGYLALGIPLILNIDIEGHGLHAVAVTGYSLRPVAVNPHEDVLAVALNFKRIGLRIDELYVHDDGHGPFAKIAVRTRTPTASESAVYFEGTWMLPDGSRLSMLEPKSVIAPVYHKVRLTFLDVQRWVGLFNEVARLTLTPAEMAKAEWQVVLGTTNELKRDIKTSAVDPVDIQRLLFRQQPRYLWRATFTLDGTAYAELLFDATGMERSVPLHDILFHDATFRRELGTTLGNVPAAAVPDKQDEQFLDLLRDAVK